MNSRSRDDIDIHHGVIRRLRDSGEINMDVYFRCLLTLAHEHMKNGDIEDSRMLVNECPEAYLTQEFLEQIEDDALFGVAMHQLAEKLAANNFAPDSDPHEFMLNFAKVGKA